MLTTYKFLELPSDMRPPFLQILFSVLWKKGHKRAFINEGVPSSVILRVRGQLPAIDRRV